VNLIKLGITGGVLFVINIMLLTRLIPSMIWIIQTEQKDPGFLIIFIISAVIILIDMMLLRQFKTLLNIKN